MQRLSNEHQNQYNQLRQTDHGVLKQLNNFQEIFGKLIYQEDISLALEKQEEEDRTQVGLYGHKKKQA